MYDEIEDVLGKGEVRGEHIAYAGDIVKRYSHTTQGSIKRIEVFHYHHYDTKKHDNMNLWRSHQQCRHTGIINRT